MFFDEFYYHHQRGLGRWESIGHPVDTLFFLICFLYALSFGSSEGVVTFVILCVLSTLIITKDEFIHSRVASGAESWLHALLFIIHPISLYALFIAWEHDFKNIIAIQSGVILLFGGYQTLYWNTDLFKKLKQK